jgi:hypothetical protein
MNLTNPQPEGLRWHPTYSPIGRPRPGIHYEQVGTWDGDGTFEPTAAVRLSGRATCGHAPPQVLGRILVDRHASLARHRAISANSASGRSRTIFPCPR